MPCRVAAANQAPSFENASATMPSSSLIVSREIGWPACGRHEMTFSDSGFTANRVTGCLLSEFQIHTVPSLLPVARSPVRDQTTRGVAVAETHGAIAGVSRP